jgi:acetyl-CoA acetyltransferase
MNAYIVAGYRTAVGKAPKGTLRFTRPDELGAEVIKHLLSTLPQLTPVRVDDVLWVMPYQRRTRDANWALCSAIVIA